MFTILKIHTKRRKSYQNILQIKTKGLQKSSFHGSHIFWATNRLLTSTTGSASKPPSWLKSSLHLTHRNFGYWFYQLAGDRVQIQDESTAKVKNCLKQVVWISITKKNGTIMPWNSLPGQPQWPQGCYVLHCVSPKTLVGPNCQYFRVCHSLCTGQVTTEGASWCPTRVG